MGDNESIVAGNGGIPPGGRDDDGGETGGAAAAAPVAGIANTGGDRGLVADDPVAEAANASVEDAYELRLTALLHQLAGKLVHKGAARTLGLDHRTVATSVREGLSRRVREALERALVDRDGDARDRLEEEFGEFRERFETLAQELRDGLGAVQGQVETLGQQQAGRMRHIEGRLTRVEVGTVGATSGATVSTGRTAGAGPAARRRYPSLVTVDPAGDDAQVFGDAWPLVEEWRRLWHGHAPQGKGLAWVSRRERILALEVSMLEDHGLTLPPETEPLRGLDRGAQLNWRRKALVDMRKRRRRLALLRWLRRALTLGLWWR